MSTRKFPKHLFLMVVSYCQLCFVLVLSNSEEEENGVTCKKNENGYTECTCPEKPITARYQDHNDEDRTCEFYYLCHLGKALKLQCRFGEVFHPTELECMIRERVPENICKPLVKCPLQTNRYQEDKRDCSKYYLCYYGKYSHWSCPEGTYFHPKDETCEKDKEHAEACIVMAKRNFYKRIGFEEPPPKTSVALDQAKKYMEGRKKKTANG